MRQFSPAEKRIGGHTILPRSKIADLLGYTPTHAGIWQTKQGIPPTAHPRIVIERPRVESFPFLKRDFVTR